MKVNFLDGGLLDGWKPNLKDKSLVKLNLTQFEKLIDLSDGACNTEGLFTLRLGTELYPILIEKVWETTNVATWKRDEYGFFKQFRPECEHEIHASCTIFGDEIGLLDVCDFANAGIKEIQVRKGEVEFAHATDRYRFRNVDGYKFVERVLLLKNNSELDVEIFDKKSRWIIHLQQVSS